MTVDEFLRFLEKTTPYGVPKVFTASLIDVVVFKFREILPMGNRRNRALFTGQKIGCLSNCRYCADRAQSPPGPAPNNVLLVLQISSKSVHF